MILKKTLSLLLFFLPLFVAAAQAAWVDANNREKKDITRGIEYSLEALGSYSKEKTPLWLSSNRYGLSSVEDKNGYLRGSLMRSVKIDSTYRWSVGYGIDMAVTKGFTSRIVIQQAYVEARWLHGMLIIGSKEQPMQLKNNMLSSGSQTLGINARPVPEVRISLPDYWALPFSKGWLRLKGHIAYGRMTDDNWQKTFTNQLTRYTENVLYHSKAGYLKIGNEDKFIPWSIELGLEMAATFGGRSYRPQAEEGQRLITGRTGAKAFIRALLPGGGDVTESGTNYQNAEGNHLGSWVARINYDTDSWGASFYADKFFEDHSAMLQLDYNGYGSGENWNTREKRRYFLYDFKDWMLGFELRFKNYGLIRNLVAEYLYTKYQSGPVYHDHTQNMSTHVSGLDNYYNHAIYTGWQHWGQAIGNPLYTSPIYNEDGTITFNNTRFIAWHFGFNGNLSYRLDYRLLATYQESFGTYYNPYTHKRHNVSLMFEGDYSFNNNWNLKAAIAKDFGSILGSNYGIQISVIKKGLLR